MNNQNNPKKSNLRRKLLLLYHQDGILDLIIGSCLVLLTLVMAFEQPAFIGLIGIPAIFYFPLKNQITIPRMGLIRFESKKEKRTRLIVTTLLGVALLIIFVLGFIPLANSADSIRNLIRQNEILLFALLVAGSLFTIGALMMSKRFMIYAVISFFLTVWTQLLGVKLWLAVAVTALILICNSAYMLIRFHHQFPKQDSE
jgi:hypothetical protein